MSGCSENSLEIMAWLIWRPLFWFFCFFGYLPVKMSRIVLAGFLGAEVPKDNIKTYPKCEGIWWFSRLLPGWSVRCSVRHLDILCWKKRFGFPTEVWSCGFCVLRWYLDVCSRYSWEFFRVKDRKCLLRYPLSCDRYFILDWAFCFWVFFVPMGKKSVFSWKKMTLLLCTVPWVSHWELWSLRYWFWFLYLWFIREAHPEEERRK